MRDDFAIFIMSYNRVDNIYTLNSLKNANYTGRYYIVVGDDDPSLMLYKEKFPDNLLVFNKKEMGKEFDLCDNGGSEKVIVYARNFCFKAAKELGLKYFAQFDDDYTSFEYRYALDDKLKVTRSKEFDEVCEVFIDFLEDSGALTVAFAQGGDLLGGAGGYDYNHKIKRKAMNSFFCKTENPFQFFGRINEDVNTYVQLGKLGKLFFTVVDASLVQKQTQKNKGGMSDTYNDNGTYTKSFYTVMTNPSCVKIDAMATDHTRIHHRIDWNKAVPKIISEKYKK